MKSAIVPPPNYPYTQPVHEVDLRDAFHLFGNPEPQSDQVVTLIKPSLIFSKNSYSTPLTMPLGLVYIAAVLEKAKYKVKVIDCPGSAVEEIRLTEDGRFKVQGLSDEESIRRIDPKSDIIGVSIMFSQEWPHARKLIQKIRAAFPSAKIVVGGEHVASMAEYTVNDCDAIDYLVMGEGEMAFLELVHQIRSRKPRAPIQGVASVVDKKLIRSGLAPRAADIREMPWPAWHLIDVEAYFHPFFTMGIGHGRNMAMLATRGCPYQCTFCSNPTMWTTRYVMRPVKDVVDEIEHNIRTYKANSIDFYDLTAIVKKDWIMDFIHELEVRKVKIVWQLPSGTRSESLDEEVIQGLAKTGCGFLVYAPESGSKRILDMIKKRVNLENMTRSIQTAVRNNIVVKVNFIIGFPYETRSDIFQTLFYIWKLALLKTDDCNISTFSPYPGSEIFNELAKEGEFGNITDAYFENLMTQFDFTLSKTVCRNVSAVEMLIYRVLGMGIFYLLSYLRSPTRIVRLLSCLFSKKPFQPRSLFEQRIYDVVARSKKTHSTQVHAEKPVLH